MFYIIYNILSFFLLIPVILYHFYRSVSRGRKASFSERFGYIAPALLKQIAGRKVIWLHAVSVGETIAARPLLKAIRQNYPEHAIVVSNTTETGRKITLESPEKDICVYFPFDFLPAVCRILNSLKPVLVIIMETEIWPNFNREAARRKIPLILANGRISDRSFQRYLKFRWFFRYPLDKFSALCMQTELDCKRIVSVGAPEERTVVCGNLKYDIVAEAVSSDKKQSLRALYGIPDVLTVVTAASTHPGEEEQLIWAYSELLKTNSSILLLLVPRHPERASEVADLLEKKGIPFQRRTAFRANLLHRFEHGEALLVDTVGELMAVYALSDIAFVGGSLVPTGGHNLLEPASVGLPTLFGQHMSNFREISALVSAYQAGIQLDSSDALLPVLRSLIDNEERRLQIGSNGLAMIKKNGGSTERHLETIRRYLKT